MEALEVSKGSMPAMSNARTGDMNEEEISQCLLDIASWLQSKAGAIGADYCAVAGANEPALAQISAAAPETLKMCLAAHDGGMPLYDFTALSCEQIGQATQEGRSSSKWQDDMVPVARNPEGDLLVVHAKGVSTWSGEDGLGSVEAVSLAAYLEGYRNKMLGGHVEYVEDCGIMELST
mmetsp:Transcript_55366/g.89688  ORF Transcript_55366/g.89688 Transcript_55366/m.89688 type:complete len:178 (+) Transcript_55366:29-562(+)